MVRIAALVIKTVHFHSLLFGIIRRNKIIIAFSGGQGISGIRNIVRWDVKIPFANFNIYVLICRISGIIPAVIGKRIRTGSISFLLTAEIYLFYPIVIIVRNFIGNRSDILKVNCLSISNNRKGLLFHLACGRILGPIPVLA